MFRKRCGCKKSAWGRCEHHWLASFKVRGTRREVTTGTPDRDAAVVEASRRRLELRASEGLDLGQRCRLSQLAAAHIAKKARENVTEHRVKVIEYHWTPVLAHFGPDFDPAKLTYDLIEGYRDVRLDCVRGQTIERELWCLKQGLRLAKARKWIREQPVPFDEWPVIGHDAKDERRAGKLHPPEVVAAVMAQCDDDMRDRIEFDARSGLRKQELLRLRYEWIERPPDGYALPAVLCLPPAGAKTGKPRVVPLPQQALAILERRFATRTEKQIAKHGSLVFPGDRKKRLYQAIAAARAKAIGLFGRVDAQTRGYFANVTLRDLRHAYLTAGEYVTKDRKAAADVAGHIRLKTTEIYLHSDLNRLAAFASAAGGWWGGVEGGGGSFHHALPQKGYFSSGKLVGTTGIEPVTPTVSSDAVLTKPKKINDRTGRPGHARSGTSAQRGRRRGAGGGGRGGAS